MSIRPSDFKPSLRIFREVLKIGITSTISQVLCSAALILFNNVAAGYGDHVISAYGVASKMNTMEFMVVFGYVQGYIPFAGYNYGAGNVKRMTDGLKFTILTGTVICLIFLIPFTILAPAYMGAFSTKPEIIEIGTQFLHAQAWAGSHHGASKLPDGNIPVNRAGNTCSDCESWPTMACFSCHF